MFIKFFVPFVFFFAAFSVSASHFEDDADLAVKQIVDTAASAGFSVDPDLVKAQVVDSAVKSGEAKLEDFELSKKQLDFYIMIAGAGGDSSPPPPPLSNR